VRYKM